MKPITFRDHVKLYVSAGNGGDGIATFRREKYVPRGGPDGGDGGRGGHVYLRADPSKDSLLDLYYRPHQRASHGGKGGKKNCHGRNGADLYITVPCGTEVRVEESGQLLGEVIEDGDVLQVGRGGKGGQGNCRFATSTNRAPTECTPGEAGEVRILILDLKIMADVGLVGYPNAGKSTLLSRLSQAHPKVAPYPFTTLNPIIGTMVYNEYDRLRVADIPGLIEGAHEGVGLGHDFLRHIERTRVLLILLDMAGVEGRFPVDDYRSLLDELTRYREELAERPSLLVANKMDLPAAAENLRIFEQETGLKPIPLSAEKGDGIDALKQALLKMVNSA